MGLPQPSFGGPTAIDVYRQQLALDEQAFNETLSGVGFWASAAGAAINAVGSYYAVKNQRSQFESQALSLKHQAFRSAIDARNAEDEARQIIEAGHTEAGQISMRYGQMKASENAARGGRGIESGGSAAEVQASIEYAKDVDVYQINSNALRAANAARAGAVRARGDAALYSVSAANARRSGRSLSPALAVGASALSSVSQISDQWLARNRYRFRPTYAS